MQLKIKAQLLSAETNTFTGNDGREVVYSRARFNVEGEIFPLSCKPEQVDVLKEVRGLYGDLTIDILSRVEKVKLVLNTFIPEKLFSDSGRGFNIHLPRSELVNYLNEMFNNSTSTCLKTYASTTETGFICNTVYDDAVSYYDFLVISGVVVFFLAFLVVKNFMDI